jgi:hypothetical protein
MKQGEAGKAELVAACLTGSQGSMPRFVTKGLNEEGFN